MSSGDEKSTETLKETPTIECTTEDIPNLPKSEFKITDIMVTVSKCTTEISENNEKTAECGTNQADTVISLATVKDKCISFETESSENLQLKWEDSDSTLSSHANISKESMSKISYENINCGNSKKTSAEDNLILGEIDKSIIPVGEMIDADPTKAISNIANEKYEDVPVTQDLTALTEKIQDTDIGIELKTTESDAKSNETITEKEIIATEFTDDLNKDSKARNAHTDKKDDETETAMKVDSEELQSHDFKPPKLENTSTIDTVQTSGGTFLLPAISISDINEPMEVDEIITSFKTALAVIDNTNTSKDDLQLPIDQVESNTENVQLADDKDDTYMEQDVEEKFNVASSKPDPRENKEIAGGDLVNICIVSNVSSVSDSADQSNLKQIIETQMTEDKKSHDEVESHTTSSKDNVAPIVKESSVKIVIEPESHDINSANTIKSAVGIQRQPDVLEELVEVASSEANESLDKKSEKTVTEPKSTDTLETSNEFIETNIDKAINNESTKTDTKTLTDIETNVSATPSEIETKIPTQTKPEDSKINTDDLINPNPLELIGTTASPSEDNITKPNVTTYIQLRVLKNWEINRNAMEQANEPNHLKDSNILGQNLDLIDKIEENPKSSNTMEDNLKSPGLIQDTTTSHVPLEDNKKPLDESVSTNLYEPSTLLDKPKPELSLNLTMEDLNKSDNLTSTSDNRMVPDTSDEVPEVTDSLGLLSESFRMVDDDQDEEHDDDDDDNDGDEDDEIEPDDEQEIKPIDMPLQPNDISYDIEQDTSMDVDDSKDTKIEEHNLEAMDIDMEDDKNIGLAIPSQKAEVAEHEEILAKASTDLEKTEKEKDSNRSVTPERDSSKQQNKQETTPTKSSPKEKDTPSKNKKLEISKPKHFVSIVDLEESSSEDDIQEIKTADDSTKCSEDASAKETTKAKSADQKEKETSTTSPTKVMDVTKEGDSSKDEKKISSAQSGDKIDKQSTKVGMEVFNLDSDEDMDSSKLDSEATQTRSKVSPKMQSSPSKCSCVNPLCTSNTDVKRFLADAYVLRYYEAHRKRKAVVCEKCYQNVAERLQVLRTGITSFTPLYDIEISRPEQELVQISDSDTDDEEECSAGVPVDGIGEEGARMLEEQLADLINDTWKKYDLDERLKVARKEIDDDLEILKKETGEIEKMLRDAQIATDKIRSDLYNTFAKRQHALKPLVIWDTIYDQYTGPDVETEHSPSVIRLPKPRREGTLKKILESPRFEPKVRDIRTPVRQTKDEDNLDIKIVKRSAESAPSDLPPTGELKKEVLHVGMTVYAMRHTFGAWAKAYIEHIYTKNMSSQFTTCRVRFENKVKNQIRQMPARQIAYYDPAPVRLPISTRVIALFKDQQDAMKRDSFYSGIIAEEPNPVNSYRYLVFFDDGYAQYVRHAHVRHVAECAPLVWDEVHPFSREFVRQYLLNYPERPMVRLHPKQKLNTEWNGKWWQSRVIAVDASLAQVHFEADSRTEWIYRGSTRLAPLYLELKAASKGKFRHIPSFTAHKQKNMPYVEYIRSDGQDAAAKAMYRTEAERNEERRQRAVAKKSTSVPTNALTAPHDTGFMSRVVYYSPKEAVKPYKMVPHTCSSECRRTDVLKLTELRTYNPLARPLLSGWERQGVKMQGDKRIMYRAPCGRRLRNMQELHTYLRQTCSEMSVDLFDFNIDTHCMAEFVLTKCLVHKKDLSHGKENVPVPCVNYYDTSLPEFCSYNTERTPTAGVPLNTDPEFLCGCDCTDDCIDKSKCACWQLTLEGARTIGMDDDVGYVYKRLLDPVPSGIYECNSRCKCSQTCLNRVAQHPLQLKLQVFKTYDRGWGIRALNDVPKGTFLCVYAGNLLTDATANLDGLNEGDEYLAELDYIEVVEQMKEGYEADIPQADKEADKESESSSSEESEPEEEGSTDRNEDDDQDFQPEMKLGFSEFNKKLRKRHKKEAAGKRDKDTKKEGDTITISDDEDAVREPSRFTADGMESTDFVSKHRSVRSYFGKDEACYIMDAKVQGNIGRYLNHSCTPNVFVQNVFVDTHDPRFPWVAFFALSDIRCGSELTWNYNYDVGSVPGKVLYCYCGAPNCRGRLL